MTDDRVETHVVDRRPRDRRAPRRALPGVLGAPPAPRCPPTPWCRSASRTPSPARACSRRSPTTDLVLVPPSNPVVSVGTILGRARACARRCVATARPGRRRLRDRRRATTCAAWPASCSSVIGVEVSAAGVAEHYGARSSGGILDGWLVDTADAPLVERVEAAGIRCRAVAADDDRPRRHRGHGRGGPRPGAVTSLDDPRLTAWPVDGIGEVTAGTDLGALLAARWTSPTATSWWSPARWSARPRAASRGLDRERGASAARPCGWWPAAGRPRSSRTTSAW